MQRTGSLLIMLLLLTAYGRCVADQFGMLYATEASCCQDVNCAAPSTEDSDEQDPHHNEDEQPPCQLCLIISTDAATLDAGIKLPSPQGIDHASAPIVDRLFPAILGCCLPTEILAPPPREAQGPPEVLGSTWLETVTRLSPVRGPSLA